MISLISLSTTVVCLFPQKMPNFHTSETSPSRPLSRVGAHVDVIQRTSAYKRVFCIRARGLRRAVILTRQTFVHNWKSACIFGNYWSNSPRKKWKIPYVFCTVFRAYFACQRTHPGNWQRIDRWMNRECLRRCRRPVHSHAYPRRIHFPLKL